MRTLLSTLTLLLALSAPRAAIALPPSSENTGCTVFFSNLVSRDPAKTLLFQRMQQGDAGAWHEWLKTALVDGAGPTEVYAISAAAQSLKPDAANQIAREIAARYTRLSKRGAAHYGPKRVADVVINSILRPERYFQEAASRGKSADGPLLAYFNQIKATLGQTESGPLLDFYDLKMAAKEFQKALKAAHSARPPGTAATGSSPTKDETIILFGSVINGRGRPGKSDIDLIFGPGTSRALISNVEGAINQNIRARYGQALQTFETIPKDLGDAQTMGVVNPLQIRITADKVEVLVYPRHTAQDPARSLPPQVYPWF